MVQQKIVIKVHVRCDKCRSKAMEIAARTKGVMSVTLEGDDKDKVVVTGDGVDPATLTKHMTKKLGYAKLVSVAEVEGKVENKKPEPTPSPRKEDPEPTPSPSSCQYQLYAVVYEDPYPNTCSVM